MKKYVIGIILLLTVVFAGCLEGDMDFTSNDTQFSIDGLVGHWSFDEGNGNVVYDYSGNDNDGTIYGAKWVDGISGKALEFDGRDDYVEVPDDDSLDITTGITIDVWIKPGTQIDHANIVDKCHTSTDNTGWVLEYTGNILGHTTTDRVYFWSGNGSSYSHSNTKDMPITTTFLNDNSWHNVVGTYDGTTARIYVDGVEEDSSTSISGDIKITSHNLNIGRWGYIPSRYFNGTIDEVYIFNRAIDESEVGQLYNLSVVGKQISVTYCDFDDITYEIASLLSSYDEDEIVIIMGSNLDFEDRTLFLLASSQIDELKNIRFISDSEVNSTEDLDEKAIILIGSEKTNILSEKLINKNKLNISKTLVSSSYVVVLGSDENNKTTLMFFTTKEFYNKENKAAEKSPLTAIIDKKYIPVVATATSIILLYLWNIIGNTVVEFVFDFASEKVGDKKIRGKKVKKKKDHTHKFSKYIDLKEIFSIIFAVIIFSIAMSWAWSADLSEFFELFFINLIVIGCIFLLRESFRIYFSYRKKLNTEHVFWPFGAALTIGSTVLGNTFSLASYTVVEDEENVKKYGKMYFLISLLIYGISILAYILNFINPSVILQMVFVFCIMGLFIDMAPINPMDGHDVKKWNFGIWLLFYIIVIISYLIMNFTTFI
jgi:Concanavalin A-like lectin/glucanases superfamily